MYNRPLSYCYTRTLKEHLGGDLTSVFNGELTYPRQLEIHLPGTGTIPCNFNCSWCAGKLLEHSLYPYEDTALDLIKQLGGRIPFFIFSGIYTEPLLNQHLFSYIEEVKRQGSFFGVHTNGSMLLRCEERDQLISQACALATPQDYFSIGLDAGKAESHAAIKRVSTKWFDKIIEGIRLIVKKGGSSVRISYLLNDVNSSEEEITEIVQIMQDIGVDSLRFSLPVDYYSIDFDAVQQRQQITVDRDERYRKILDKVIAVNKRDKPFIFYISPEYQDVAKMNFKQCIFGYYQITFGADRYVYRCSTTASPTFKMNRLGKVPDTLEAFNKLLLANTDKDFDPKKCFCVGGRCNRIALELNQEWAKNG